MDLFIGGPDNARAGDAEEVKEMQNDEEHKTFIIVNKVGNTDKAEVESEDEDEDYETGLDERDLGQQALQ